MRITDRRLGTSVPGPTWSDSKKRESKVGRLMLIPYLDRGGILYGTFVESSKAISISTVFSSSSLIGAILPGPSP